MERTSSDPIKYYQTKNECFKSQIARPFQPQGLWFHYLEAQVQRGKQHCALVNEFRGSMLSFRIRMGVFAKGPEEDAWDCNAKRLGGNLTSIEMVHLSHWHQDHSGGMLRAIEKIAAVKSSQSTASKPVVVDVDLHPNRPDYRGFVLKGKLVSFATDPTWEEIDKAGAFVSKSSEVQTALDDMLFRANPHLTLRARQPTTHVTPRRSAHPRFTSTSPILTSLLVRTPPPHLCSPVLPGMCSSPVSPLSRASTPGEKDSGEPERAPGGP